MRRLAAFALAFAFLSAPALRADVVVTKSKQNDAGKAAAATEPAPTKETTWYAKDRMRVEEGDRVTIVRADLKKLYRLDTKAKTVTTLDLPFDMKKYMPPEVAPMIDQMMSQVKVTVTPTTETKKIKDWNATRYTMTTSLPMGGMVTEEIWATKDVEIDYSGFGELANAMLSTGMGGAAMVAERKKIEGMPLVSERTTTMMGKTTKSREEVTAVETKEAPEGLYDVPKDYTEKPFDPMAEMGGPPGAGGPPPAGKPKGG